MRNGSLVLIGVFLLVVSFFSFFFAQERGVDEVGISGFLVASESSFHGNATITRQEARVALNESQALIFDMQAYNFSTLYVQDVFLEAGRVFEHAYFAEILSGENVSVSQDEVERAKEVSQLIDLDGVIYADVLTHTHEIGMRFDRAFVIYDSLTSLGTSLETYYGVETKEGLLEESVAHLQSASLAFYEDRYDDAERSLRASQEAFESEQSASARLTTLGAHATGFIKRYFFYFLVLLGFSALLGYWLYRLFKQRLLRRTISKLRAESTAIRNLMKKTQEERFKRNTIPELVYRGRMKKYLERIEEIKERLPVVESRLKRYTGVFYKNGFVGSRLKV